jgi:hypothetical protein
MAHYLFTHEGVMDALCLSSVGQLTSRINKCTKLGLMPYKVFPNDVRLYDADMLENPTYFLVDEVVYDEEPSEKRVMTCETSRILEIVKGGGNLLDLMELEVGA